MALNYLLDPMFQIENSAGKPATEGWLEVYLHGTRTKYYCASDFNGTLHPFKIKLDSLGSNIVLADDGQSYDVYAYNRFGSLLMSRYNVQPGSGGSGGSSGTPGEMQHWLGMYGPTYTPFPGDNAGHTLGISKWEIDYVGDFIDRIETCPYPDGTTPNGYIYLKPGLYFVSCIIRYQQADDSLSNTLDEILMYTGAGNANESLAYQMDSSGPEATGNRHNVRVQFIRKVPDNVSSSVLYFAPGTPVNWKEAYIQKLEIIKLDSVAISPTIVQGLEKVNHDDTITGDGTVLNPLSIQSALDNKQDTLTPGEGIAIDSDGVISATDMSNIYWCRRGTTTYAEAKAAYDAGKHLFMIDGALIAPLAYASSGYLNFVYCSNTGSWGGPIIHRVSLASSYGWGDWSGTFQSDWNSTDNYSPSFVRNKPNLDNYQKKLTPGEGIDLDSDGNISVDTDELPTEPVELSPLVAGENVTIQDSDGVTVISSHGGDTYTAGYGIDIDSDGVISVDSDALPSYTPGEGIDIDSDGVISVDSETLPTEPVEFTPLVAGHGITIEESDNETVISATGEAYSSGYGIIIDSDNVISVDPNALPTYTPGEGIDIDSDGVISVDTDDIPSEPVDFSPLVAGRNITIEESNGETVISAADAPVYTAGENIVIDSDGVISAPDLQKELIPGEGIDLDSDGNISVDTDDIPSEPVEFSTLVAGRNITLEDSDGSTVISAADAPIYTAGDHISIDSDGVISAELPQEEEVEFEEFDPSDYQKALVAGEGIDLDSDGNISVDQSVIPVVPPILPLVAGENITIVDSDGVVVISSSGGGSTYTAGYGIDIDGNGVISVDSDDIPSGPQGPQGPPGPAGQSASYDSIPIEAGTGISLAVVNDKLRISADTSEVQQKLTAGQNITITSDGVISATAPNAGIDIGNDYFTLTDSDDESLEVQCTPTETMIGYDFHGSNASASTIVDEGGGSMPASFTAIQLSSAWNYPIGTRVEVILHKDVSSYSAPRIMISSSASSQGTDIGTIPLVSGVAKAGTYVFNTSGRNTYSYVVMRAPMPTTEQCTTLAAGEFEIYINPVYKKSVVMASKDYVDNIVGNIETILGGI